MHIVVIGAGPGGYVAALRAARLGYEVTLVEADSLGGVCLNWGCIPSKALLKSGELFSSFQHGDNLFSSILLEDFSDFFVSALECLGYSSQGFSDLTTSVDNKSDQVGSISGSSAFSEFSKSDLGNLNNYVSCEDSSSLNANALNAPASNAQLTSIHGDYDSDKLNQLISSLSSQLGLVGECQSMSVQSSIDQENTYSQSGISSIFSNNSEMKDDCSSFVHKKHSRFINQKVDSSVYTLLSICLRDFDHCAHGINMEYYEGMINQMHPQISRFFKYFLSNGAIDFSITSAVEASRDVVKKLNAGIKNLMSKMGVNVIYGYASFDSQMVYTNLSKNVNQNTNQDEIQSINQFVDPHTCNVHHSNFSAGVNINEQNSHNSVQVDNTIFNTHKTNGLQEQNIFSNDTYNNDSDKKILNIKLRDSDENIQIVSDYVIISTGSSARKLNPDHFEALDKSMLWSVRDAMISNDIPHDLVVIGGGAIGLEFASFYNAIGKNNRSDLFEKNLKNVIKMLDSFIDDFFENYAKIHSTIGHIDQKNEEQIKKDTLHTESATMKEIDDIVYILSEYFIHLSDQNTASRKVSFENVSLNNSVPESDYHLKNSNSINENALTLRFEEKISEIFQKYGKNVIKIIKNRISCNITKILEGLYKSFAKTHNYYSYNSKNDRKVTVIEMQPNILATADKEISMTAKKLFEKRGIEIITGAKILSINNGIVSLTDGRNIQANKVLVSIGVVANTAGLGLENTHVILENGFIKVGCGYETNHDGIFAIGDVIGHPCLAHKATHEAIMCVEYIAIRDGKFIYNQHQQNVDNSSLAGKEDKADLNKNSWYEKYVYEKFDEVFGKQLAFGNSLANNGVLQEYMTKNCDFPSFYDRAMYSNRASRAATLWEKNTYDDTDCQKIAPLSIKQDKKQFILEHFNRNSSPIPMCIYTSPQVAYIGLTEEQVVEAGYDYAIGKFPFIASGKALAISEEEGFVKVILNKKDGQILGAHMVGHEVTELVSNFSLAISSNISADKFLHSVFPHPTLSEALAEAVMNACNKGVHY